VFMSFWICAATHLVLPKNNSDFGADATEMRRQSEPKSGGRSGYLCSLNRDYRSPGAQNPGGALIGCCRGRL
jgi:hypothetical protein